MKIQDVLQMFAGLLNASEDGNLGEKLSQTKKRPQSGEKKQDPCFWKTATQSWSFYETGHSNSNTEMT